MYRRETGEKIKELSANNVAFVCCRSRLIKVLADIAKKEKGSKGRGGRVR